MMRLLNDIEIERCLCVVLGITALMVLLISFDVPVLRQVVGFLFLTIVPGVLILRILKIHDKGEVETLAYTVGLSLAFTMFTGTSVNFILPLFGISQPLTIIPLEIAFGVGILLLSVIAYIRDKGFIGSKVVATPKAKTAFLLALPILAVAGALVGLYYDNNILLLLLIIAIAVIVALVSFGRVIPDEACGLAVVIIALALLYHTSISSLGYNMVGDFTREYKFTLGVLDAGYWDWRVGGNNLNTALSLMVLNPVYAILMNMSTLLVFRVVYPLFFCLVPLILFEIYRIQFGAKVAFLSAVFFMSVLYFTSMLGLNRQQVAELFFALFILLMVERSLRLNQKVTLVIIFAAGIVVSHYALGFICAGLFVVAWIVMFLFRHHPSKAFSQKALVGIGVVFLTISVGWYGLISSGQSMESTGRILDEQTALISGEGKSETLGEVPREPLVQTALGFDFMEASPQGKAFRLFQYITEIFIIVGCAGLVFGAGRRRFKPEFVALIVGVSLILSACIFLPYFSGHLESERFYQISLMLLAPLCITGGAIVWQTFAHDFKHYFKFVALVVIIPYFLFTSGFVFEITQCDYKVRDTPSSIALSGYRLPNCGELK